MPRKIIQHPTTGRIYSVTHSAFVSTYQALGYAEIGDEADPIVYLPPPTFADIDDFGAWDTPPFYLITSSDGRRYGVTLDNYTNRYQALGFTIGAGLGGEPAPGLSLAGLFGTAIFGTATFGG